ncbi:MAG: type IV pilus modification protein PilV [Moraxellaceae bacterium]
MMKKASKMVSAGKTQSGVSMLEVLVALLVTSVGLLGFASLQSRALVSTEDTYQRTQATSLAQDIVDRMRMNGASPLKQSDAANAVAGYTTASNWGGSLPATNCLGLDKLCSQDEIALYDIAQIRRAVETSSNLPNGSAIVAACESARVCAYVAWGDVTAAQCVTKKGIGVKTCVVIQGG